MPGFKKLLDIIPSAIASRAFGVISDLKLPNKIQHVVNHGFATIANLNMDEASENLDDYNTLNALFTRELKPDARPIAQDDLVSPVDGKLSYIGKIQNGTMIEAKGQVYDVEKLIGSKQLDGWETSAYAFTIYLSPKNYHHIHSPVSGTISAMCYVPGRLLPVNRLGYLLTDDLLPANERLTTYITDNHGHRIKLIKIGATCVGRISVVYDDMKTNAALFRKPFYKKLSQPWEIQAGSQLGCFELGSTVVLLVESENFTPDPNLKIGQPIQLGNPLGNWEK